MAKEVKSFNEIIAFVKSFKVEETDAIHIAESFMDSAKISFDADGNFDPVTIDFSEGDKKVTKA